MAGDNDFWRVQIKSRVEKIISYGDGVCHNKNTLSQRVGGVSKGCNEKRSFTRRNITLIFLWIDGCYKRLVVSFVLLGSSSPLRNYNSLSPFYGHIPGTPGLAWLFPNSMGSY